jgi:hypothetical protein
MKSLWILHLSTLAAACIWAAWDPSFETMIAASTFQAALAASGWWRVVALVSIVGGAFASMLGLLVRMFGRRTQHQHRSVRQWLAIITVIALWCSFAVHLDTITWQGKRVRFATRIDQLEAIVDPLRKQWPLRDGELPSIGPFMAYPFGRPTTLVLLQAPRVADQSVYVSAIERCGRGAIKLQLTGNDGDAWAEWHPPGSRPSSFVGGLADQHELTNASIIGDGWYLVRYTS